MFVGFRTNAATSDFSKVLPEEMEQEVKDAAEISMGTEISDEDLLNVKYLCEQVRLLKLILLIKSSYYVYSVLLRSLYLSLIMPPTLKKLEGHIAFGLSVCMSVCACVSGCVC